MLPLLYFTADIIRLYLVCYAAAQVLKCNYVHICNVSAAAIMEEENDLVTTQVYYLASRSISADPRMGCLLVVV